MIGVSKNQRSIKQGEDINTIFPYEIKKEKSGDEEEFDIKLVYSSNKNYL